MGDGTGTSKTTCWVAEALYGVLLVGGKPAGYYNLSGASWGLQVGGQDFSYALFFMTDSAITELTSGTGMSVGVGPSVVVVDAGMARSMTTTTLKSDVYAFIFGQEGLMAGMGVQGQRIVKFDQ